MAPLMLELASTWGRASYEVADGVLVQNTYAPLGFASLTVILVGLIVLWKGYLEEIRWTWFIMLIIVSVWAFPVLVLPNLLHWKNMVPISEWFPNAIQQPGIERDFLKSITTCALLLIALIMSAASFVSGIRVKSAS
jgi:hypothetical protein